tara:strand:+ start:3810 stop:4187 length:378 start_codon:yes stop_codon:yes gene_type:complete
MAEFDIYLKEIAGAPPKGTVLCRLRDIEDGRAREFTFGDAKAPFYMFVQRRGAQVFAYENACPHMYAPLNLKEGVFTEKSGRYFLCNFHGALFEVETGKCVAGPCAGRSLRSVAVTLEGGNVVVL